MEEDIEHYVIWTTQNIKPDQCKQVVDTHFPLDDHDVIILESPQKVKSVQTANHVQVLVRPRKTGMCFLQINGFQKEVIYYS